MEKVNTTVETKHFINCPHCGSKSNQVSHLFNDGKQHTTFGPWYCDECGNAYKGKVIGKNVYIEKTDGKKDKCLTMLRKDNALIIFEDMYFNGELDLENKKYFYEEHTCPTNYLKVDMVVDLNDGDKDPHGIFEFITTIPYIDLDTVEDVRDLIRPYIILNDDLKHAQNFDFTEYFKQITDSDFVVNPPKQNYSIDKENAPKIVAASNGEEPATITVNGNPDPNTPLNFDLSTLLTENLLKEWVYESHLGEPGDYGQGRQAGAEFIVDKIKSLLNK